MLNPYDTNAQSQYLISVTMDYYNETSKLRETYKFDTYNILIYEISKDSVNYNHNLHLLTLTNINTIMYNNLNLQDIRIIIEVQENGLSVSNTTFRVKEVHKIDEVDGIYNVQLFLISDFIFELLNTNQYAKVSTFDTSSAHTYITAYQLVSKIIQTMSSDKGSLLDADYNSAGEVKNLYESIRIPEGLNNFEIFEYLFKEYPPYLLNPYLIIDDFHITDKSLTPYSIILLNICDINGSYPLKNVSNIDGFRLGYTDFENSTPLLDYAKVYEELKATLMIKNENENRIFELKPITENNRSNKVIQLTSTLSIDAYKQKLYMRKKLADSEASIESYAYDSINLKDITFGNVYNISDPMTYDHLPVGLFYKFIKRNDNNFGLEIKVDYLRIPGKLLSGN